MPKLDAILLETTYGKFNNENASFLKKQIMDFILKIKKNKINILYLYIKLLMMQIMKESNKSIYTF